MSENKPLECLDKIHNRQKDLYELVKKVLTEYECSKKISEDLFDASCKGIDHCVLTDITLCRDIHKVISKFEETDNYKLLEYLFKKFYIKLAAPSIGEYFLLHKKVPLNKDETDYLVYKGLELILFWSSGMYDAMHLEAISK